MAKIRKLRGTKKCKKTKHHKHKNSNKGRGKGKKVV